MKKKRIDINSIDSLNNVLKAEGYSVDESFLEVKRKFSLSDKVIYKVKMLDEEGISYRANDLEDFFHYIEKIIEFNIEIKRLKEKLKYIEVLNINRVEYDRVFHEKEDLTYVKEKIKDIKKKIYREVTEEAMEKVSIIENEIEQECIYSKDIEILKKIFINNNIKEIYNEEEKIKSIFIKMPKEANENYIKLKEGSLEYHYHLNKDIPRIKRLIKNIDNYIKFENEIYIINQSKTMQDTVNIAYATFNEKVFKAVSGQNNLKDYCIAPEKQSFESVKVNKKGEFGVGYNRFNDSEKKIFEEIHKEIKKKNLRDEGEIVIYSKLEPCPSCYFVMSQFKEIYPKINIIVKYKEQYGEKDK